MGEFKNVLKVRNKAKQTEKELENLNKAIRDRGERTLKVPHLSDKKTGEMMIDSKRLSRHASRLSNLYKRKRNIFVGKTGAKAALAGTAIYGGKKLLDEYGSVNDKQAGYLKRVADSASRLFNFSRKSAEIKDSARKATKEITKELKRKKPDPAELGHLNAKKVKEGISAKNKKLAEAASVAVPVTAVSSALYLKNKYDESHPSKLTSFHR